LLEEAQVFLIGEILVLVEVVEQEVIVPELECLLLLLIMMSQ
jgi:hypothetical protein